MVLPQQLAVRRRSDRPHGCASPLFFKATRAGKMDAGHRRQCQGGNSWPASASNGSISCPSASALPSPAWRPRHGADHAALSRHGLRPLHQGLRGGGAGRPHQPRRAQCSAASGRPHRDRWPATFLHSKFIEVSAFIVIMFVLMFLPNGLLGLRPAQSGLTWRVCRLAATCFGRAPGRPLPATDRSSIANYCSSPIRSSSTSSWRIGLNMLVGFAGHLAFANAAMFGIGAYGTGLLQVDLGWPFWLALPGGALIAILVGLDHIAAGAAPERDLSRTGDPRLRPVHAMGVPELGARDLRRRRLPRAPIYFSPLPRPFRIRRLLSYPES